MGILDDILGNQIVGGNEEAWLRMLLEDNDMLKQMGLPSNLSDIEKDELVTLIMADDLYSEDEFNEPLTYNPMDGETPAQWMIKSAMTDMGISENMEVNVGEMRIGSTYKLLAPNSKDIECKLISIRKSSLGDDYFFKNISGGESLCGFMDNPNEFHVPIQLLAQIRILEL